VGKNSLNEQLFLTRNGRHVIPGSSFKGMLRSLSEIIGGGCHVTDPRGQYSKSLAACHNAQKLCIACRMFGMMERGSHAKVHMGNVSIGDALIREEKPQPLTLQVLLSSCGTRHEPFYRTPKTGRLDGKSRKFYFHQPQRTESVPNIPENLQSRAQNINALKPGHHFDFEVHFTNLNKEEIELLIYTLVLEENSQVEIGEEKVKLNGPLRHKIGHGKPLGLGSCHITINKIVYLTDSKQRFASLQQSSDTVFEGESLKNEISGLTRRYAGDNSEVMQQLRKMLIWDESDTRNFGYPDYYWFKNPVNSQKILKHI
jgi:CRISPR/Cas system CSM-associated protein Csm3 (group 7 of RAMP superfamily)